MNTVMTAGLHHRWRARAAEMAALRPGDRALDVATGTGDLALELARRTGPTGEVVGSDFSEAMLERARAKGAGSGVRFELGRRARAALRGRLIRRRDGRFRRAQLRRPRRAACARWCAWCARAGASSCSRSRRPRGRRSRSSTACGSIASCPAIGEGARASPTPTHTCRARYEASHRPRRSRPRWSARASREIGYVLTAGSIIAIHAGTVPRWRWAMHWDAARREARSARSATWPPSRPSCAAAGRGCARA